jgi:hypothetical protein
LGKASELKGEKFKPVDEIEEDFETGEEKGERDEEMELGREVVEIIEEKREEAPFCEPQSVDREIDDGKDGEQREEKE